MKYEGILDNHTTSLIHKKKPPLYRGFRYIEGLYIVEV
jgi:hypothetical protein